jgi:hypothetical protein
LPSTAPPSARSCCISSGRATTSSLSSESARGLLGRAGLIVDEAVEPARDCSAVRIPLQITRGGGEPSSTTVPNQSAWLPTIDRLLDEYRRIGLDSA